MSQKLKRQKINAGDLVKHLKKKKLGIVLKSTPTSDGFYYVMSEGNVSVWHMSNMHL